LLDEIQALCIASGSPTDDIVNLDIIILLSNPTSVHSVGELDEDRIFLHDPLNMLSSNSDDPLVVLIWDVEGDGSRHLLLDKIKAIFGGFILIPAHVDVEIVLVEAIKDDLYVTCRIC